MANQEITVVLKHNSETRRVSITENDDVYQAIKALCDDAGLLMTKLTVTFASFKEGAAVVYSAEEQSELVSQGSADLITFIENFFLKMGERGGAVSILCSARLTNASMNFWDEDDDWDEYEDDNWDEDEEDKFQEIYDKVDVYINRLQTLANTFERNAYKVDDVSVEFILKFLNGQDTSLAAFEDMVKTSLDLAGKLDNTTLEVGKYFQKIEKITNDDLDELF